MDEINPLYKAFKLAVGVLLSLIVAGYVVGVGITGGLDNHAHPRSREELETVRLKFEQKSQTASELLADIQKTSEEDREWNALVAQDIREDIGARIERQRKIAARRTDVPDEHRISFGKQLEADLAEGLSVEFPDLLDIHLKSVLMQEPDAYEALAGSKVEPNELMEYVVKISVDQGWLVAGAMYNEQYKTAAIVVIKDKRQVFIALLTRDDVFENYPTTVYYSSVSEKYQDYEIPNFAGY